MHTKRFLSLALSLLLLISLLPMSTTPVSAEEALTEGQPLQISAKAGDELNYLFYPQPDTVYVVYTEEALGSCSVNVWNPNPYAYERVFFEHYLAINRKYSGIRFITTSVTSEVSINLHFDTDYTGPLTVVKADPSPDIQLSFQQINDLPGKHYSMYICCDDPRKAGALFEYGTSSNPAVAEYVADNKLGGTLSTYSPGTTTVTVHTNVGTFTCDVTVKGRDRLYLGTSQITVPIWDQAYFQFTPEESGTYVLTFKEYCYAILSTVRLEEKLYGELCNDWVSFMSGGLDVYRMELQAGNTYLLAFHNSANTGDTFEVTLAKATSTELGPLEIDQVSAAVDMKQELCLPITDPYAIADSVSWAVADSSVLELHHDRGYACDFTPLRSGSTTLTATTSGGKKFVYTVNVNGIQLNWQVITGEAGTWGVNFFNCASSIDPSRLHWVSSNEAVAKPENSVYNTDRVPVELLSEGTAILSAQMPDGSTTAFLVVVTPAPVYDPLTPNESISLKFGEIGYDDIIYSFAPQNTCSYTFMTDSPTTYVVRIVDKADSSGSYYNEISADCPFEFDFLAGHEYLFYFSAATEGQENCNFWFEPVAGIVDMQVAAVGQFPEIYKGMTNAYLLMEDFVRQMTLEFVWHDGTSELHKMENGSYFQDSDICWWIEDTGEGIMLYMTCAQLSCEYLIPYAESPVLSMEVVGEKSLSIYENEGRWVDGYDENNQPIYIYIPEIVAKDLQFKITFRDGSSKTVGLFEELDGIFIEGDFMDVQYSQAWVLGDTYEVSFTYLDAAVTVPVTIVENPVQSIQLLAIRTVYPFGSELYGQNYYPDDNTYRFSPFGMATSANFRFLVTYKDGSTQEFNADMLEAWGNPKSFYGSIMQAYGIRLADGHCVILHFKADSLYDYFEKDVQEPGLYEVTLEYMGCHHDFALELMNTLEVEKTTQRWDPEKPDKTVSMHIEAPMEELEGVYMNGAPVEESNYTITEGSTVITFKAEYLATLPAGKHQVDALFRDGIASMTLSIAEKEELEEENGKDDEKNPVLTIAIIAGIVVVAAAAVIVAGKKLGWFGKKEHCTE